MTRSKSKGKCGELEVAKILRDFGFDARRGQQYCGANGDADVVGLPGYHIEVKRTEAYHIDDWWDQATVEARLSEVPVLVFRKSRHEWKAMLELKDFLELVKAAMDKE